MEDGAGRLLLEASDSPLSASLSVELVDLEDSGIDEVEDPSGAIEEVEASIVVDGSVGSEDGDVSALGNSVVAAWLVVDSVCVVVVDNSDDEVVVGSIVSGIGCIEEEVVGSIEMVVGLEPYDQDQGSSGSPSRHLSQSDQDGINPAS